MQRYVSFDVGGTTVKHALVDDQGNISNKQAFETIDSADELLSQMIGIINKAKTKETISGVGISVPGIVRDDGYMITGGAIKSLNDYPLAQTLERETGLPVAVENDANAAAIAEHWLGAAQGVGTYLTVVLGTGVGGGIVIDGKVYRGAHGMAGEFGWNIIHDIDPTCELEHFSLNWHASVVTGLVDRFNKSVIQAFPNTEKVEDAQIILKLAADGDPIAGIAVSDFLRDVSIMIINLFANFDPEKILIGGGISANDGFMHTLQDTVDEYITRHESLNRIRNTALGHIETAKLRNDAGLIGAAYRIKQKL